MLQSPLDCSAGIQKVGNQASYLAFPREAKEEPLSLFCHQTGNFCWGLSFPTGAEGSSLVSAGGTGQTGAPHRYRQLGAGVHQLLHTAAAPDVGSKGFPSGRNATRFVTAVQQLPVLISKLILKTPKLGGSANQ